MAARSLAPAGDDMRQVMARLDGLTEDVAEIKAGIRAIQREVIDRLDAIEGCLHRLQRAVERLSVPVDVLTRDGMCKALGITTHGLRKIDAREVFTDARPPEKRRERCSRVYYADEATIYRSEGAAGVRRYRREVGRL